MVTYIRSDLEFILEQIKISEAHTRWILDPNDPLGRPLFGPDPDGAGPLQGGSIPSYNIAWGLRTVDGTFNHLLPGTEQQGAADNPFPRLLDPVYRPAGQVGLDMNGPAPGGVIPTAPAYDPSNDPNSIVVDSSLRTISNLLVDQTLSNPAAIIVALQRNGIAGDLIALAQQIKAEYEPIKSFFKDVDDATDAYAEAQAAADAADPLDPDLPALEAAAAAALADLEAAQDALTAVRGPLDALLVPNGIELSGANVELPNIAPDEGLSAPFNSWFTLFGQFFDHGLDLVAKGGSGTVFIPLLPDDPLYDPTSPTNFMVLTRATVGAGEDGVMGTADDVQPVNNTTSFVDQNQTYSSHSSHQVFLRQYELNADGDPVATGKLIEGGNGGMATWADLKAQAADLLGIQLLDVDVGNIPLLATDEYGNFLRGPNGYPQIVMQGLNPGDPPFLVEGDPAANGGLGVLVAGAVRTGHAFLADIAHNAVPDGLEDGDTEIGGNIPADGEYDDELLDAHFMAGDGRANENIGLTAVHHVFHSEHNRLVEHTKEVVLASGDPAFIAEWQMPDGSWNGERLFQAAKFGTEMQYQHLVFEEFARKIQPAVNTFLVPDGFDITLDPSIVAEFAHVVYRFGHSMLTESIDRYDSTFNEDHISLIQGFLNPLQFENNGGNTVVDADIAAGDIIRGMTRQAGNQIDEFVTSALRNNLLGLPLDLATINLARGRDTGVPSLNAARANFYEATNEDELLKPYESWVDFAANLKNEASIINFVAAYGTHALITSQTTVEGKRDAALTIITGVSTGGLAVPADRLDFLGATGAYAGGSLGGLNNVDLWIGGLAEKTMPFGGMLGSTFNFVFEVQMENLQSGDRFYYLQRLDGLHLFGEMEANSFAAMIMRNTDATHLPSDVFSTPGLILEVDPTRQFNDLDGDGTLESLDPDGGGILTPLVSRNNPGTPGTDTNYLRYTGGDHVVMGGTDNDDIIIAGIGDDTIHGDGGNDRLEGGYGNDIINGGAGDDIIKDTGGDDNIKGGDGNDVVHSGPGLDLVLGGRGNDFIFLGTDEGSEVFAGEGDDFIYGNKNAERILGNEGSDWIETGTFDGAPGDNFDEVFSRDGIDGHDVFLGDGGFDEFIGEGGHDIMVGSAGRGKMVGMSGFDWATYKDNTAGVNADLSIPIVFDEAPTIPGNAALDEYESMEGLSGTALDDILRGTNDDAAAMGPTPLGGSGGYRGSALDQAGIDLIDGLQEVVGAGVTSFTGGDIILGGAGSDLIAGQGGDDIIDGDKYLNVRIGVFENNDGTGAEIDSADSMTELAARMFSGALNPGQLKIVREILDTSEAGDVDTALFSDDLENYDITENPDGTVTVAHARGTQTDGTDTLRNIEQLQFADQTIVIAAAATGQPVINDLTPTEGQTLTLDTSSIADVDGLGPFSYQWQSSVDGTTWADIGGATAATFTPDDNPLTSFGDQAGLRLRVVVSFTDGDGALESVTSEPTGPTGVNWNGNPGVNNMLVGTAGDDIAVGAGAIDTLNGGAGTDLLDGGNGNDVLNGGTGVDTTIGGLGNDRHYVDDAADVVVETAGGGASDRVLASASYQLAAGVDIEFMSTNNVAGTAAINLTGNELANNITGNDGVNILGGGGGNDRLTGGGADDVLNGNEGNDILDGGAGADTTNGGAGDDRHYVNNAGDVVVEGVGDGTTDRVFASVSYQLGAGVEVEVMTADPEAGTDPINLTGNEFDNRLFGNAGTNVLNGGGGNDILYGMLGADTTNGGSGNDRHYVDNAGDTVVEAVGGGASDRVLASVNYQLNAGAEVEFISTNSNTGTNAINLTGNEFANNITGNDGANTIDGGGGNDQINGRAGDDLIVQTGATGGRDVINGGDGVDTYQLNGSAGAEAFVIYTRTAAQAAIPGLSLSGGTEIVVTRDGQVIAELDNIEEININALNVSSPGGVAPGGSGGDGGDTIQVIGNFNTTSLNYNTITVNGGVGNDTVDISGLTSAHRLVFNTGGGADQVVGNLRPQDVIDNQGGSTVNHAGAGVPTHILPWPGESGFDDLGRMERFFGHETPDYLFN